MLFGCVFARVTNIGWSLDQPVLFKLLGATILIVAIIIIVIRMLYLRRCYIAVTTGKYSHRLILILSILVMVLSFIIGAIQSHSYVLDKEYFDNINEGASIRFQGKLAKKEKKTNSYYLYFNNIITDGYVCESNESFILQSDSDELPINSVVIVEGQKIQFNKSRNEGNFDEEDYYNSLGVVMKLQGSVVSLCEEPIGFFEELYRFRKLVSSVYEANLPGEEAGIISAMSLGDKSELDSGAKELFKLSGLAHILAISGLHISVVGMTIYRLLRKRGRSFVTAGIIASLVVSLYGIICGGTVSTIRAMGMFFILIFANITGRSYDSISALSVLIMYVCITSSFCITSAGFIFSFTAIAGIAVIVQPLIVSYDRYCRLRYISINYDKQYSPSVIERLSKAILSAALIQLVTLPLVCYYYNEIPVYVIILNLIVIPFLGVLLGTSLGGGICGAIVFIIGMGNVLSIMSSMLLDASHVIIYCYELLASLSLRLPGSRWITGCPSMWEIGIYYVVIYRVCREINRMVADSEGLVSSYINRHKIIRTKIVGITRLQAIHYKLRVIIKLRLRDKTFIRITLSGLCIAAAVISIANNYNASKLEIDMIDVGQGDGILISSQGVNYMIDGGSSSVKDVGKMRILPYLKYKGIRHIDYWFISHSDSDHISGLIDALNEGYRIDNICYNPYMASEDNMKTIIDKANKLGTNLIVLHKGDIVEDNQYRFSCIYGGDDSIEDINANSTVLLGEYIDGNDSILLGGDMTSDTEKLLLERDDIIRNIDVLKVAHHGSKTSSSKGWLEKINPRIALISVGENNRYGHPHETTLESLKDIGTSIYRTDQNGRIKLEPVDGELQVVDIFMKNH